MPLNRQTVQTPREDNVADQIQCDNCGAVLGKEDTFCGECGVPRPSIAEVTESAAGEPSAVPDPAGSVQPVTDVSPTGPSPSPPAGFSGPSEATWRPAAIVLIVLGVIACLAGLLGFLLLGSVGGETTTTQEDWLIGALCCLLPIGGTGALLAAVGAAIWHTRLRRR